ncbi:MAG: polysaccharide biosynthesis C-terminal domain-containing protein [Planctomycetes bacterium]|nr:polysaccharide biosynthesis C-terminal domain-containing protein [Planctomycetota bacterium]MBL7041361.1 polysaccharide biosynthesis C-terminal domain-containing protein [Pirellulaceae bacterium]
MADTQTSLRSAGWVSLWSFAQLIVQFGFQVVLAKHFGASADMDAFVAAIALPTVLSSIFVGSLGYAFVPVLTERLSADDPVKARATANSVLTVLVAGTVSLSTAVSLLARPLTGILYPGFSVEQSEVTAQLVAILAWLIFTNGSLAYSQAVHHCHRHFIIPAIAPVVGTGATLVAAIMWQDSGIVAIGYAVLLGSIVAAAIQILFPLRGFRLKFEFDDAAKRCFRLMVPLICGAAYFRLDPLVDRHLASSLATGSVSHLGYASRLVTALLLISTSGLSVVAFPNLAMQRATGRLDAFRAEVAHAVRCLCVILPPIAVGLACYSKWVIRDLFQRGEFTATDTRAVATLLTLYLGMVIAAAFGEIATKVFFALSDTRTPTIIGCAGFTLGVILKVALTPSLGVAGIVIATSLYYMANVATMAVLIVRRLGSDALSGMPGSLVRSLLASTCAVVVAFPIARLGIPFGSIIGAACGAAVYVVVMTLERDEFAMRFFRMLTNRGGNDSKA